MNSVTLALDAMGGDHGVSVVVPAALNVLQQFPGTLNMVLVGDSGALESAVRSYGGMLGENLRIRHTTEVVGMDEPPAQALRFKKNSSMRVAIDLVKHGEADACVSAGNTGALMATARFVLKTWPGIDRPAISALLPTMTGNPVRMLDLGANVDSSAEHLFQFAIMGSVLAADVSGVVKPKVGLLNVGAEDIKGNEQVKEAAKVLGESRLVNYFGYVEGDDIYKGTVDVIVCDGFVGNVALKASEGLAKMIGQNIKDSFRKNIYTRFVALLTRPILKQMSRRIDPSRYNGASLVGLQGIVVKSHGGADKHAFSNAIKQAVLEARNNAARRIGDEIARMMREFHST